MSAQFLKITTAEKKNGFLLIEIFERFFYPQKLPHGLIAVGGRNC
jgi:hypothetical protein